VIGGCEIGDDAMMKSHFILHHPLCDPIHTGDVG
jgi:hypothetical protein